MDDRTLALVAHIPVIGWLIAFFQNQTLKGDLTTFYLRQNLGFYALWVLIWVIATIISYKLYWILMLALGALWVLSLLGVLSNEKKLTPFMGDMFQQWFKGIG